MNEPTVQIIHLLPSKIDLSLKIP